MRALHAIATIVQQKWYHFELGSHKLGDDTTSGFAEKNKQNSTKLKGSF